MCISETSAKVSLKDFEVLKHIGSGSFGKVMKVRYRGDQRFYAMKTLKKDLLLQANMMHNAKQEKNLLLRIDHPFIVKLHFAFQTRERLYMVLDLLPGGELYHHLRKDGHFTVPRARLYAAEIASALHYLHTQGIVYRDLKLENVVLDATGHACLTDLGLAQPGTSEMSEESLLGGTAGYIAPEILLGGSFSWASDWWAFGVLLYEMLTGQPPFPGLDVHETPAGGFEPQPTTPSGVDAVAADLVSKLLQPNVQQRLCDGSSVLAHEFFKPLDMAKVLAREVNPEYVPTILGDELGVEFSSTPLASATSSDASLFPNAPTSRLPPFLEALDPAIAVPISS